MRLVYVLLWAAGLGLSAGVAKAALQGSEVSYAGDGLVLKGYLAYDDALPGERPAVLVVHEWWGHNLYARRRADMLASEGYVALAVDLYGEGRNTAHPGEAKELMMAAMGEPDLIASRFQQALAVVSAHPATDPDRIGAIGYCFGGGVVLNMARTGANLLGVVSFHGSLATEAPAQADVVQAQILVLNGEADPFVPAEQVQAFRAEMDAARVNYEYVGYPQVQHSFTNPDATRIGKAYDLPLVYDPKADDDSWRRMLAFFDRVLWPAH